MKTLNQLFYDVILLNELSGNVSAALRFSDPDGPSGRSGWSFGVCQFDTKHNDLALSLLNECGFSKQEIAGVVQQSINVKPLEAKLKANSDIVAHYDQMQLSHCLQSALNSTTNNGVLAVTTGPILCLADYCNQYGSIGPSFVEYLNTKDLTRNIQMDDIQEWKLKFTKYGREHPKDCERRYANILHVMKEANIELA
jgi:hypothetical protein